MRRSPEIIVAIAALVLFAAGCHSPSEPGIPIASDNPTIIFSAIGGFAGEQHKLTISASGLAYNQTVYPTLQLQLTRQERDSLLLLLDGFEDYEDTYPSNAMDDFHFKIALRTSSRAKTVEIDGFALFDSPALAQLAQLISKLRALENRVYQEKSTWLGLQYQFALDRAAYKPGDTITVLCHISNPTTLQRILYFRNNYHLQFGFAREFTEPHVQSWVPDMPAAWGDTFKS